MKSPNTPNNQTHKSQDGTQDKAPRQTKIKVKDLALRKDSDVKGGPRQWANPKQKPAT